MTKVVDVGRQNAKPTIDKNDGSFSQFYDTLSADLLQN
jgi:hypothetical protein